MSKIRVGFIGVGTMGQCAHLQNYATLPDCEVVALAEIQPKLAAKVARRYDVPKVYEDHRTMLATEQLDAVVCIQPFTRHGQLLPEVFDAGRFVITEKPLASSLPIGRVLHEKAEASPATYFVAYHKRSDPATIRAKAEIESWKQSGQFGAMRYIRVTMPPGDWIAGGFNALIRSDDPAPDLAHDPKPDDMDDDTYRQYTAFVNYYIHQVNLIRHLLGEDYRVSYADPSRVLLVGHSDSGVTVNLEMAPYHNSIDWQEQAMVCFEKGYIKLDLPAPVAHHRAGAVTIMKDAGGEGQPVTMQPTMPWVHAMRQQAIHFIAAARGEATPLCTTADALKDLEIAHEYIRQLRGG